MKLLLQGTSDSPRNQFERLSRLEAWLGCQQRHCHQGLRSRAAINMSARGLPVLPALLGI